MSNHAGIIQQLWTSYLQDVVHPQADSVQIQETRRAFYAGAKALFSAINSSLSPDPEPTLEDLAMMQSIQYELNQFVEDIKAGRA